MGESERRRNYDASGGAVGQVSPLLPSARGIARVNTGQLVSSEYIGVIGAVANTFRLGPRQFTIEEVAGEYSMTCPWVEADDFETTDACKQRRSNRKVLL